MHFIDKSIRYFSLVLHQLPEITICEDNIALAMTFMNVILPVIFYKSESLNLIFCTIGRL